MLVSVVVGLLNEEKFLPRLIEDFKKQNSNLNTDEINKLEFKFKNNIKISIDNLGILK